MGDDVTPGRLYVGYPLLNFDALGICLADPQWLHLHPTDRAAAAKAVLDSGADLFLPDPYAADLLPPERVIVISSTGRAAPLTRHPEFSSWNGLPTGEMWSTLGEAWVDEVDFDASYCAPELATAPGYPMALAVALAPPETRWTAVRCYQDGTWGLVFRFYDTEAEALAAAAALCDDGNLDPPGVDAHDCDGATLPVGWSR